MTDVDDVLTAARARAVALATADVPRLLELLHPDFHWTTHLGQTFARDAYIERNTAGTTAWRSQDVGAAAVDVVGTTAVLRTVVTDVIGTSDGDQTFTMPMTQVWVRSTDQWQCLAGHAGPRMT